MYSHTTLLDLWVTWWDFFIFESKRIKIMKVSIKKKPFLIDFGTQKIE